MENALENTAFFKSLIRCERAMLLLVNEDATDSGTGVFSRVFDLEAADLDNDAVTSPFEGRFPLNTGITRSKFRQRRP